MLVVAVVVKAMVWAEAVVNMLAEALAIGVVIEELTGLMVGVGTGMLADVEIIAMAAAVIALEFAVTAFDVLIDALADVLSGKIIGVVTGVGVDVFTNVEVNGLVAAMTILGFAMPAPLYEFSCCCAVSDCWPMALSNFASVLQVWMPSYHV